MPTHDVTNQPPPLAGYDAYGTDLALVEAVHREGGGWGDDELRALGTITGSAEVIEWGFAANANPPTLHTHDRYGNRRDEVTYHPAYHQLMTLAVAHGTHAALWTDNRPGVCVRRASRRGASWTGKTCRGGWQRGAQEVTPMAAVLNLKNQRLNPRPCGNCQVTHSDAQFRTRVSEEDDDEDGAGCEPQGGSGVEQVFRP